jgi:hypothetical protein
MLPIKGLRDSYDGSAIGLLYGAGGRSVIRYMERTGLAPLLVGGSPAQREPHIEFVIVQLGLRVAGVDSQVHAADAGRCGEIDQGNERLGQTLRREPAQHTSQTCAESRREGSCQSGCRVHVSRAKLPAGFSDGCMVCSNSAHILHTSFRTANIRAVE